MATKEQIIARLQALHTDPARSPELEAFTTRIREQDAEMQGETIPERKTRLIAYLSKPDAEIELGQLQKALSILRKHGHLSAAKSRILSLESSATASPDVVSFAQDIAERLLLSDEEANQRLSDELAKTANVIDAAKVERLLQRAQAAWRASNEQNQN
jgi:hypothetical protein